MRVLTLGVLATGLVHSAAAATAMPVVEPVAVFASAFVDKDRALTASAKEQARAKVEHLARRAPAISRPELRLFLSRIVALADNAGSLVLDAPEFAASAPRLPLRLAWFPDGWLVIRASADHSDLVGGLLTSIDGRPIDSVVAKLMPYYGGSQSRRYSMVPMLLEQPALLAAAGIARSADAVAVTVRQSSGKTVTKSVATAKPLPISYWPDRWSAEGFDPDAPWVHATRPEEAPLFLRDYAESRRVVALPELDATYVQIKWNPGARTAPAEPFKSALESMRPKVPAISFSTCASTMVEARRPSLSY